MKRWAIFSGSCWDFMVDFMVRNDWVGEVSVEKKWVGVVWGLRCFESLVKMMRKAIFFWGFRVVFLAIEGHRFPGDEMILSWSMAEFFYLFIEIIHLFRLKIL